MEKYKNSKGFDELIEIKRVKIGTEIQSKCEEAAQMFIVSEMLNQTR